MLSNDTPKDLEQESTTRSRLNFLKKHLAQAAVQEVVAQASNTGATIVVNRVREIILPSLLAIGIGVLAVRYPHALDSADPHYFSGGRASAFFVVLFFFLLKLVWNQIGGFLAIALGFLALVKCILPNQQQLISSNSQTESNSSTLKQKLLRAGVRVGTRAGANYIQQQRNK